MFRLLKTQFAIMLIASSMVTVLSCSHGEDDPLIDYPSTTPPSSSQPDEDHPSTTPPSSSQSFSIKEPYHNLDGSPEDVKSFMMKEMPQCYIWKESETIISYEYEPHSVFGIDYHFWDGKLDGVVCYYPLDQWDNIVDYYDAHYQFVKTFDHPMGYKARHYKMEGDKDIQVFRTSTNGIMAVEYFCYIIPSN